MAPVAVVVNGTALVVWTLSGAAGTGGPSRFAGVVSVSLAIVSAIGATVVAGAPGADLAGPAHLGGRPAGGGAGERRPPALVVAVVVAAVALALAAPAMVLVGGRDPGPGPRGAAPGGAPPAFDAQLPVDFSGVAGVTPAEQARAEDLATRTLQRAPDLAASGPDELDAARLHALGDHSIGDGGSGYEHWVDWPAIDDDHVLDPEHPEALVFRVDGPGRRTLAAAIYTMRSGDRMGDQPDVGGALTPWHVLEDLCDLPRRRQPVGGGRRGPALRAVRPGDVPPR